MAQSVASTAAKASYLQNMPTQVLTPPPFVAVKKDPKLANNWKTKKPDQLTDAEVMAMSDNDYMNDAQLAFFRLEVGATQARHFGQCR
jgi:DnaK suppressor protein